MTEATARLSLPCLAAAQAQKHVTHNEALHRLDALIQTSVISRDLTAPPPSPAEGDLYVLPEAGQDGWAGYEAGALALFSGGAWRSLNPFAGWIIQLASEGACLIHDGADWRPLGAALGEIGSVTRLGLNTQADSANPFAAKLNNALFAALGAGEGGTGDLRLLLNREGGADTVSLIFQSGWSGRAELGLAGEAAFSLRVSANGSDWETALRAQAGHPVEAPLGVMTTSLNGGPLAGFRNAVINGGFERWSRGVGLSSGYFADRWRLRSSGGLTPVFTRGPMAPGELDDFAASLDWSATGGAASDDIIIGQPIENVRRFAGRTVTLSFYAKAASALTVQSRMVQDFGSGGSPSASVFTDMRNHAVTPAWTRFTHRIDLPSLDGAVIGNNGDDHLELRLQIRAPVTDPEVRITGVQLEPGEEATPFEYRPEAVEAALCDRYFRRIGVFMPDATAQLGLIAMRRTPDISGAGAGADFTHTSAGALIGKQSSAGLESLELDAEF